MREKQPGPCVARLYNVAEHKKCSTSTRGLTLCLLSSRHLWKLNSVPQRCPCCVRMCVCMVLEMKPRVQHMLLKYSATELSPQPIYVLISRLYQCYIWWQKGFCRCVEVKDVEIGRLFCIFCVGPTSNHKCPLMGESD